MAKKARRPARTLITLLVAIVVAIGALVAGHFTQGATFTPKLALDLQGGTQLILTPRLQEGTDSRDVSSADMDEAIRIIRQRIDASGVSEAEISTLGSSDIVVAIPGEADEEILSLVRSSATMRFRPVLVASASPAAITPDDLAQSGVEDPFEQAIASLTALGASDGTEQSNSSYSWITPELAREFLTLDCTVPESLTQDVLDDPEQGLVACDASQTAKYLLGPADLEGTDLTSATAGPETTQTGQPTGRYAINLQFNSEAARVFSEVSQRLLAFEQSDPGRNQFAVVLDGNVLVAPKMNSVITDGQAQITGTFTAAEAQATANQLQFGSLPLNFEVQSEQQISATLGSAHLQKGLMAGVVGLLLVILYMVWQYRGLSLLSAGSLLLAAGLTYLVITILSWTMGFRLSLPGVAGLIVSIGITADSFIVYFERIRDEIREGRSLDAAVETGWDRAKRTILISDAVNLVAAIVLYVLAVGGVQGFAFTLGVTTLVDLLVVFAFTHPMMELFIRTRFYGSGNKWSGLDPLHLGAKSGFNYMGRGQVDFGPKRGPGSAAAKPGKSSAVGPERVAFAVAAGEQALPLAERRRLARLEAARGVSEAEPAAPDSEEAVVEGTTVEEVIVEEPATEEAEEATRG